MGEKKTYYVVWQDVDPDGKKGIVDDFNSKEEAIFKATLYNKEAPQTAHWVVTTADYWKGTIYDNENVS